MEAKDLIALQLTTGLTKGQLQLIQSLLNSDALQVCTGGMEGTYRTYKGPEAQIKALVQLEQMYPYADFSAILQP